MSEPSQRPSIHPVVPDAGSIALVNAEGQTVLADWQRKNGRYSLQRRTDSFLAASLFHDRGRSFTTFAAMMAAIQEAHPTEAFVMGQAWLDLA
ncbi:MAG: hypothetical protein F4Y01_16635 [Gammaproteobacteria bacterium]|nr:hypothetical protein [Gammaproteobacteria bacterium]